MLDLLLFASLPLLLAAGAALLSWRALSKPKLFLFAASGALYALYALGIYAFGPASVGFEAGLVEPGQPAADPPVFPFMAAYAVALAAFGVAALPTLAVLLKLFKQRDPGASS